MDNSEYAAVPLNLPIMKQSNVNKEVQPQDTRSYS